MNTLEIANDSDFRFLHRVLHELECDARYNFPTSYLMFHALAEEVGELAQALLDCQMTDHQRHGSNSRNAAIRHVYAEAVQVAITAIRLATEGDLSTPAYLPLVGEGTKRWAVIPNQDRSMSIIDDESRR